MNRTKNWKVRITALVLGGACLGAGTVLAAGDKADPLVTLSYLEETVIPAILSQIKADTAQTQAELEGKLQSQVDSYKAELQQSGTGDDQATYTVVTLTQSQQLKLGVGCEMMLRVGSATVQANTSPGLIDVTTGGECNNGASLEKNHLYMATIPDRTLTATAATTKLLVRGSFTMG